MYLWGNYVYLLTRRDLVFSKKPYRAFFCFSGSYKRQPVILIIKKKEMYLWQRK